MPATVELASRYAMRRTGDVYAVLYANPATDYIDVVRCFECADEALDALIDLRALEVIA